MAKMTSDIELMITKSMMSVFTEPRTVNEVSKLLGLNYYTAYKRIRRLVDQNLISYSHTNSQHEKVYRASSVNNVPLMRYGRQENGSPKLIPIDTFVGAYINSKKKGQINNPLAKEMAKYPHLVAQFFATRVEYAKADSNEGEDEIGTEFRKYLTLLYEGMSDRLEEVKMLLDHPYLWDEDMYKKWAPDFDEATFVGYRKLMDDAQ
jgi:DNA-binding Lrp family transcriptional regulator